MCKLKSKNEKPNKQTTTTYTNTQPRREIILQMNDRIALKGMRIKPADDLRNFGETLFWLEIVKLNKDKRN